MQDKYWVLVLVGLFHLAFSQSSSCDLRATKYGYVCVCNVSYCDSLVNPTPKTPTEIHIVSSSKNGLRFSTDTSNFGGSVNINDNYEQARQNNDVDKDMNGFDLEAIVVSEGVAQLDMSNGTHKGRFIYSNNANRQHSVKLQVDRSTKHQRIVGFGGAFTGTVSYILQQMEQNMQDQIYRSFFHSDGIGFNMLRTSIGGCDFDLEPWAYNEEPRNDKNLSNFTKLSNSDELKIEQIKRLKEISLRNNIKIMAAAWSSPTWMKSNERWTGYSYLKPEYYQTWADYHLKYLELMAAKNMPIWAISTGNEPLNGVIGWLFVHFMSLGWTPSNQAIWLSEHLGPTIRNSKYKNVLIFGNDDQRYTYPAWFDKMKSSRPNSVDYLDGLAVHWYWDDVFDASLIDLAHNAMPDKLLVNTESCVGDKPWETHGPELGSWARGEKYARSFLQDLQHNFNAWLDWNIVLDEQGGPNYVHNYVDAPVIVNTTSNNEFYKQPIYYAIGHFSKFIPEGSVRVDSKISSFNLNAVAFQRPDASIVVVLLNSDTMATTVTLADSVRGACNLSIPPKSIHTIIYK